MAKRSPILGYNHNVKYRGIVFHVQTEDSGLGSPHLFTHLFHEGVIVSTRKLVYDPGANEEAIKSLMQAQHKAVMKDLMKGTFDEKIDQYLGNVAGLEPSGHGSKAPAAARGDRAPTEVEPSPPEAIIDAPTEHVAAPPEMIESIPLETLPAGDQSVPIELTIPKPRTTTVQKGSKQPPPPMDDPPTVNDPTAGIAAAVAAANTRASTPPPIRAATPAPVRGQELEESLSEDSSRMRLPRDTAVESVTISPRTRTSGDGIPKPSETGGSQPTARRSPTGERPASDRAASLPPMRPPSRPQVAAPTRPPTAEPPAASDRGAGTYSMGRARPPSDNVPLREKTGRIAAINPAMVPQRERSAPVAAKPPPTPASGTPVARQGTAPISARDAAQMRPGRPETPGGGVPARATPQVTAPIQNRNAPPAGVVMTRPAVIVGAAPSKPTPPPAPSRVRKAREDEGRGFGQGLISEKSLDEVILAYLSEDAEDK